jgi:hypothetical protein
MSAYGGVITMYLVCIISSEVYGHVIEDWSDQMGREG